MNNPDDTFKPKLQKMIWFLLVIAVMLTFAATGLKRPWAYGYYNYTIDWKYGYIPRGLTATVLRLFLGDISKSYLFLTFIQYFFMWAFFAFMAYISYDMIFKRGDLLGISFLLIFFTSPFCVFYPAQIGFLDHIVYLFALIQIEICLKCSPGTCLISGGIFSSLTTLVLQTGTFTVCPVIATVTFLRQLEEEKRISINLIIKLAVCFSPTLFFAYLQSKFFASADTAAKYIDSISDAPFYNDSIKTWLAFFQGNYEKKFPEGWVYISPEIIVYVAIFMIIGLQVLYFNKNSDGLYMASSTGLTLASSVLTMGPLLVGGTDFHRYYFSCGMAAFLINIYLLRKWKNFLNKKREIAVILLLTICTLHVMQYRIWNWNGNYNSFWFERFLQ